MNYTAFIIGGLILAAIGLYNWRYGVFTALVLVIVEGAIRKWLLTQNSQIIYFAKEIVLLSAYARFFFLGGASEAGAAPGRFNELVKVLLALCVGWIFLDSFNPGTGSIIAGLFGWRSYVIFIPLCLMVPSLFQTPRQLEQFLRWYLLLALPVGVLGMLQFYAPPESPLNVYAPGASGTSESSEVAVFGDDRFVRVTGTFSYVSGYSTYLVFTLALLLPVLVSIRSNPWRVLLGATVVLMAGNMGMTGSRSTVLGACIVLIGFVLLTVITGTEGERSRSGIHLLAGTGALIGIKLLFTSAFLALQQRVDYDWEENQTRLLAGILEPWNFLGLAGFFGHGPGVTQPAVAALRAMLQLKDPALEFSSPTDSENSRVLVELGIPGFFLWYGLRILLVALMWRTRAGLKSPFLRQIALGAFLVLFFQLFAVTVFGPTSNLYHWFLVGFIPLLPTLDSTPPRSNSTPRRERIQRPTLPRSAPIMATARPGP